MASKPTGLQKANQKRKNTKFAKNFPQKLATGKRMGKIKAAHEAMANPEISAANQKAVESKLAKAKSLHEGLTGKSTSAGVKSEPQGTGLNVESKPKSQSQSIQEKQEAKLAERVKSYRDQAKKPKKMSLPTVQKGHGAGSVAPVKRGASYGGVRSAAPVSANPPHIQKDINKREEAKDYAKYQSAQPHTPAPAFGPRQSSSNAKSGGMGSIPGANVTSPMAAKMSASAKSFTGPTASQKVIAGMSQAGQQAKAKKQNKMAAFGKGVAAKVKAASAAGKEKHDQKPGLNPMDYKGASMFKHLKHAFSEKGPIGKMVNRGASKYDKGFEKVVAPIEHGIKTGVKKAGSAIKSGAKGVYGAVTSPTAKGLLAATATHAGMAVMHGSNYPQKMHEYASRGPREFRPGWHGFTSPVEKPHAGEATDTKEERA